jgi:hypothetical protein
MLLINDNELMEALIGGISFFIVLLIFRGYFKWHWLERAAFIFPFTWLLRKLGMNIYKYIKATRKISDTKFNIMDF